MLAFGWLLGSLFGSGLPQRIAISIECGLQNGTLAIVVATLLFGGGATVIPAATYSLTMFATALIFIYGSATQRRAGPCRGLTLRQALGCPTSAIKVFPDALAARIWVEAKTNGY